MDPIINWTDIPDFSDEAEEARYWETHELDGRLMATSVHAADSRESMVPASYHSGPSPVAVGPLSLQHPL